MDKYYYCNLCGAKSKYEQGNMPRLCPDCEGKKHKLYYKYERRPPESFPSGRRIKQLCLERDDHKCVKCGSTDKIDVHHKDGNNWQKIRQLANNNLANLITLCHSCHMKLHHRQGDLQAKKEKRTLDMITYHNEHPEIRHAKLATKFNLSRERVGQVLGRVRKKKPRTS